MEQGASGGGGGEGASNARAGHPVARRDGADPVYLGQISGPIRTLFRSGNVQHFLISFARPTDAETALSEITSEGGRAHVASRPWDGLALNSRSPKTLSRPKLQYKGQLKILFGVGRFTLAELDGVYLTSRP